MKITLIVIGKTDENYLKEGIAKYSDRLKNYCSFNCVELADVKRSNKISFEEQKRSEAKILMQKIPQNAQVILLDEKGKEYSSRAFANQIEHLQNTVSKEICFIVGGPYGFSDEIYARAQGKISLSKMTFSHQMIRLFFVEQLYRAYSILNNLPYHHD